MAFLGQEYKALLVAQKSLLEVLNDETAKAPARAACAGTLVKVLDMKRILRMRPKPRDLDTLDPRVRRREPRAITAHSTVSFTEEPPVNQEKSKESLSKPEGGDGVPPEGGAA